MAISRLGRTAVAVSGLAALAAVVIWFGMLEPQRARVPAPAGTAGGEAGPERRSTTTQPAAPPAQPGPEVRPEPQGLREARRSEPPASAGPATPAPPAAPAPPQTPPAREALAPSFDIVRVEPTGESVIAGRAAPGATVELLRNGKTHARVASDASGLFAFVPTPFPPGPQEIVLQSIAPDGTRTQSRESVTIAVAERKDAKPLIALTTPDKPTVILSSPDAPGTPEAKTAETRTAETRTGETRTGETSAAEPTRTATLPDAAKPDPGAEAARQAAPQPPRPDAGSSAVPGGAAPPAPAGPRAQVRVASVEAEEGGRLFVTGQAAPGATVRLYLNGTLIAPGSAGTDGRVSFAIGRGVRPGGYRVRLDDVDPVSGEVRSRAEVEFRVPAPLAVELPPPAPPYVTNPPPRAPEGRVAAAPGSASPPSPASGGIASRTESPSTILPGAIPIAPPASDAAPGRPLLASGGTASPGPTASATQPTAATQGQAPGQAPGPTPAQPSERIASADAPASSPEAARAAPRDLDPGTVLIPEVNTAIVSRGDNLWRISKRVYGRGVRYTVIYRANEDQIRSPRLIYPGQVFVLPPEGSTRP